MKPRTLTFILFLLLFRISTTYCIADDFDWPRWRGPNGDGISKETDWNPEALAQNSKILWKADIGLGHSNVVIKNNLLYTMGQIGGENIVFCLNAETGEEIWRYQFEDAHDPMSTPTIDGKYVYALSTNGILLCLKAKNGKIRWEKDIVSKWSVIRPFYGFAGSPMIAGDIIILTANTSGLALNKKSGEKIWVSDRPPEDLRLYASTGPHYTTPVLFDYEEKQYAVISSYIGMHAVDVETGKVYWLYEWEPIRELQIIDPLIFDKYVFITQWIKMGRTVLLEIEGGEPKVLWESLNMESEISSPVVIDGYIYGVDGGPSTKRGSLQCLDANTGELMWNEKLNGKPISLMAADGKLIILDEKGTLYISEVSPASYKEISKGDIFGGEEKFRKFYTPPVLCNGKIYCRNYAGDLVCIDVSK